MAGSLRSFSSTKITFFVFLDIITAVTGIFIFIVLLLSFRLGENNPAAGHPAGTLPSTDPAQDARLAGLLRQLETLGLDNRNRQAALTGSVATPDAASLRGEIASLKSAIADERAAGARLQAVAGEHAAEAAALDDALGLTADRSRIQQMKRRLADLAVSNDDRRKESDALENAVKQAEARLLDTEARRGNRLWLVPDLTATSKEPVLVVVSARQAVAERFNKPASRVTIGGTDGPDAFRKLLDRCNKLDDYFVFYVRPSGIERFEEYVREARGAGFEVGYDAIEEERELVFSRPKE